MNEWKELLKEKLNKAKPKSFSSFTKNVRDIAETETCQHLKKYGDEPLRLIDITRRIMNKIDQAYMGGIFPSRAVEAYIHKCYIVTEIDGLYYFNPQQKTN